MADIEKKDITPGLGEQTKKEWPKVTPAQALSKPIDRLKPGSELHRTVLKYLLDRLEYSEREMAKFYGRWRVGEARSQAYIDLPDWEKSLKELNESSKIPQSVPIVVPYTFASISTIVTYLIHTFGGRKPILQVASTKAETAKSAQNMELVLQHQADHTRLIRELAQWSQDGEQYGVGILKTLWVNDKGTRTVWRDNPNYGFGGVLLGSRKYKVKEERTIYQGNDVSSIDPFLFFPDPRVPMHQVSERGEFVFWRAYEGKHLLKREEAQGRLKWVDSAKEMAASSDTGGTSVRNLLTGGSSVPGQYHDSAQQKHYYQIDQGTVEIIPAEIGLGESEQVEKWLFSIANKDQIVQAQPLSYDHGKHPVSVIEPYSMGYGFGQPGISDYLGPIQDVLSWLVNSHMDNVKTVMNNMLVVDPSMIEMQDLKKPGPGKLIRLKRAAFGQDVRAIVNQLQVQDVTQGHIKDMELFTRIGDALGSINDNVRGVVQSGGRKTATEIRTTGESAASRLAAHARIVSAQGVTGMSEQMSVNTQQFLEDGYYISIVGQEGAEDNIHITPEMVVGDFHYPVHDGTLPLDKVALLDVWKEIFIAVQADPELRQTYGLGKIFEFIAEMGGARNIESFKVQSDDAVAAAAAAGNVAPLTSLPGPASNVQAAPRAPGQRAAQ